VTMTHR